MGERPRLPSTRIGTLLFPDAILKAEFEANAPLRGNGYQGRSYLISLISHRASQCSSPRRPYVHATALASKGTRLTVHILAAVAEHEREMISERTKAAWRPPRGADSAWANPTSPTLRNAARPLGRPMRGGLPPMFTRSLRRSCLESLRNCANVSAITSRRHSGSRSRFARASGSPSLRRLFCNLQLPIG